MNTMLHYSKVATLSAILLSMLTGTSWAQSSTKNSGFGSAQVANLQNQNSASQFSVGRIQNSIRNRAVGPVGVQGVNARNFLSPTSGSRSQASKPFSSLTRGPTVNPYLALSAPRASASDYYNLIRPQQQQQRVNQRQQALNIQQQRRLNQLAARAPFSTTGDENSAPTGHAAVFQSLGSYQNTGGYFPPPSQPKQR